jgi:uncharacterized membrane protein YfcA
LSITSISTLPEQFQLPLSSLALAAVAVFIVGLSKSGIKGIFIIVVLMLAHVFESKASTGIVVPFLICGDIIAVWYYKKHVQWKILFKLLPWMVIGVLLGVYVGKDLNEANFKTGLAIIILISVIMMFWWERKKVKKVPNQWWFAGIMGLGAGFTTMIGNMAGVFSNLFFLAMRLPKNEFIGTAAWLFFIINLFKLPFHIFVWKTITIDTLNLNLHFIPFLLVGFWVGLKILTKINDRFFRNFILFVTFLGALFILLK